MQFSFLACKPPLSTANHLAGFSFEENEREEHNLGLHVSFVYILLQNIWNKITLTSKFQPGKSIAPIKKHSFIYFIMQSSFQRKILSGGQITLNLLIENNGNEIIHYADINHLCFYNMKGLEDLLWENNTWVVLNLSNHFCCFLTCPNQSCMHANNGNVLMPCCVLVGVTAPCMTAFGDANIGMTCFNFLCY